MKIVKQCIYQKITFLDNMKILLGLQTHFDSASIFPHSISSIVNEVIRTISSLFIYFCTKRFRAHKNMSQAKINEQNKIKRTKNSKGNNFLRTKTSKRVEIVCLRLSAFFAFKIFS